MKTLTVIMLVGLLATMGCGGAKDMGQKTAVREGSGPSTVTVTGKDGNTTTINQKGTGRNTVWDGTNRPVEPSKAEEPISP